MLIRYHLDEHIDPAICDGLRARGIDVTTPQGRGLLGATDEEQLSFAHKDGRVLVTRDQDFLRLHAAGVLHSGIVFWHSKRKSLGAVIRNLTVLWRTATAEELVGRVQFF